MHYLLIGKKLSLVLLTTLLVLGSSACAQENDPDQAETQPEVPEPTVSAMTPERLDQLLRIIDPDLSHEGNVWELTFQERQLLAVIDPSADRMRIMTPIAPEGLLDKELAIRLLQADFDAALDARYAVAQGIIWGVFIHPLAALTGDELASAIVQVSGVAENFGTTYSSGVLIYGGGDSNEEQQKLLEEIQRQLNPKT